MLHEMGLHFKINFCIMKTYIVAILLSIMISCQPKAIETDTSFEATFVEKQTIGCRLPVIEFTKGLDQARKLAEASSKYQGYFSAYNLDTTYWQPGKKLKLTIRKATQLNVCDALGIAYPAIEVVSVKE